MKEKICLYARVSLDEKDETKKQFQNPENQLRPLREFCKSMNYEIIKEYIDKASGSNPARPQFREMMHAAMLRKFSGIIVWKLDRFSREGVLPTLSYIKKLKDRGIWLKSMTESWADTSQEGIAEILFAIMSWMASEERKKISERTKAGIKRLKAIGKWKGGRPKKNLTKEQEDEVIRLYNKGKGILTISRKFKISRYVIREFLKKRGVLNFTQENRMS